ncbi:AAA family ATPase [Streptococcus pneumoniae]
MHKEFEKWYKQEQKNSNDGVYNQAIVTRTMNALKWYEDFLSIDLFDCYEELEHLKEQLKQDLTVKDSYFNVIDQSIDALKKFLKEDLVNQLKCKLLKSKNIILHGAPGTGKTHLAKTVAAKLIRCSVEELEKSNNFVFIQFHPNYDYTDFIEGLRPFRDGKEIGFKLTDGIFKEFCKFAQNPLLSLFIQFLLDCKKERRKLEFGNNTPFTVHEIHNDDIKIIKVSDVKTKQLSVKISDIKILLSNMQEIAQTKDVTRVLNRNSPNGGGEDSNLFTLLQCFLDHCTDRIIDSEKLLKECYRLFRKEMVMKQQLTLPLEEKEFDIEFDRTTVDKPLKFSIYPNGLSELLKYKQNIQRKENSSTDDSDYYKKWFAILKYTIQQHIDIIASPNYFVFVIDEINRGDLSKIFGELFFSLDAGYRGEKGSVLLQYSSMYTGSERYFYIPDNVYIIGTMNDIDRSVQAFDFAMRRRFRFIEITAEARKNMLMETLSEQMADEAYKRMSLLNIKIDKIFNGDTSYHIGPSYFLKLQEIDSDDPFKDLWLDYLKPILEDYLIGVPNALDILKSSEHIIVEGKEND